MSAFDPPPVSPATFGAKTDVAATDDTGSWSLLALFKRALQNWTTLLSRVPAKGQAAAGNSLPVVSAPAAITTTILLNAVTAIGAGGAASGMAATKTYHASGLVTAGTGGATIQVLGTMNGTSWDLIGTITLALGTVATSDSFTSSDRYAQIKGNVTAISGTAAAVTLIMGC